MRQWRILPCYFAASSQPHTPPHIYTSVSLPAVSSETSIQRRGRVFVRFRCGSVWAVTVAQTALFPPTIRLLRDRRLTTPSKDLSWDSRSDARDASGHITVHGWGLQTTTDARKTFLTGCAPNRGSILFHWLDSHTVFSPPILFIYLFIFIIIFIDRIPEPKNLKTVFPQQIIAII